MNLKEAIIVMADIKDFTVDPDRMLEKLHRLDTLNNEEAQITRSLHKLIPQLGPYGRKSRDELLSPWWTYGQ